MSNTNTGGPAFPLVGHFYGDKLVGQLDHGMTLRDYFAAKGLNGILSRPSAGYLSDEEVARQSYSYADAMLKAREA